MPPQPAKNFSPQTPAISPSFDIYANQVSLLRQVCIPKVVISLQPNIRCLHALQRWIALHQLYILYFIVDDEKCLHSLLQSCNYQIFQKWLKNCMNKIHFYQTQKTNRDKLGHLSFMGPLGRHNQQKISPPKLLRYGEHLTFMLFLTFS